MSAAMLSAVSALVDDADPKIATLARALVEELRTVARPAASAVRRIEITELEARIGVDRTTIYRWYSATPPRFPPPRYHGVRRVWDLAEVEAWETARAAAPHAPQRHGVAALTAEERLAVVKKSAVTRAKRRAR